MSKLSIIKITAFFITIASLNSCADSKKTTIRLNTKSALFYSVNKSGVYQYSLATHEHVQILLLKEDFMDNSLQYINDTLLTIGYEGPITTDKKPRVVNSNYFHTADGDSSVITEASSYTIFDEYLYYTETFYAIHAHSLQAWKYKIIEYEHIDQDTLKTKTTILSIKGDTLSSTRTIRRCGAITHSSDGLRFCDYTERFHALTDSIANRQVLAREGNLYLLTNNKESCILKYNGHYEPKFGSGYYSPTISPDALSVVYLYNAGFLKAGSGLFQLDMQTKKVNELSLGYYSRPLYSPDGQYLLVGKDKRNDKPTDSWIKDIYLFDLKNNSTNKIGEGDLYLWKR